MAALTILIASIAFAQPREVSEFFKRYDPNRQFLSALKDERLAGKGGGGGSSPRKY